MTVQSVLAESPLRRVRLLDRLTPTFLRPDWIQIVVAGNADMFYQRGYPDYHAHREPVTRRVDVR